MKYFYLLLLTYTTCYSIQAQNGLAFEHNKSFYLKGNSILIGNNIISVDNDAPFNDPTAINDNLKLS
ncbi:hypothetical protein [Aestuariibaculum sediminum]|uniref:Uncharacterized protein n=1 Tax=Aestuariibaculum sediminum TaxID=2770637 RepID=A0A8J6U6Z7_9FLAO|nr:hypothetical protein [Aestuariibaculum sediminum]MBD0831165.1 hypothetical protein [Aestuariibaculum sediminum]